MPCTPSAETGPVAGSPLTAASRAWPLAGGAGDVELWVLQLEDIDAEQLDPSVLDAEEHARAESLAQVEDRAGYVAAHVLLRELLSGRLGLAPSEVSYAREPCPSCGRPHGRPILSAPRDAFQFSISRSAGTVLIGLSPTRIGVDVEALPGSDTASEVAALLHPAEREEIEAAPPARRPETFARLWARKEAYLKGVGIGVAGDLTADYLGTQQRAPGPLGWTVLDVPVGAGYAGAAAVERG
jgi:4'-phosphopantetheinyl transferase